MESLGVVGFEPGGAGLSSRVNEIQQALRGRDIKVSAICAGFSGFILAEDPKIKAEFDSTMRDIIAAAGGARFHGRDNGTCFQRSETVQAAYSGDKGIPYGTAT